MTYWIFAFVAALASGLFFYRAMRKAGVALSAFQVFGVVQIVMLSGYLLSRFGTLVENRLDHGKWDAFDAWLSPQFHWYGAVLGAALVWLMSILFSSKDGQRPVAVFFGILAQTACIIFIVGKLGCFADGHPGCIGGPTELPWGVNYHWGTASSNIPLHPAQLYSAMEAALLFVLLRFKIGVLWSAPAFFILHAISEFSLEFLKPMPRLFFGVFSLAHLTYLLIAIVGSAGLGIMLLHRAAMSRH